MRNSDDLLSTEGKNLEEALAVMKLLGRATVVMSIASMILGCERTTRPVLVSVADIGTVIVDADSTAVNHVFSFRNPSVSEVAQLTVRRQSCTCIRVRIEEPTLEPGDATRIYLSGSISPTASKQNWLVELGTELQSPSSAILKLSATGVPRCISDKKGPVQLTLDSRTGRGHASFSIVWNVAKNDARSVLKSACDSENCAIKIKRTDRPFEDSSDIVEIRTDIEVTVELPKGFDGTFRQVSGIEHGTVALGDKYPCSFTIAWHSDAAIHHSPDFLFFSARSKDPQKQEIKLSSTKPFVVRGIESDFVTESEANGTEFAMEHLLVCQFSRESFRREVDDASIPTELILQVTHPDQSEVRVPMNVLK